MTRALGLDLGSKRIGVALSTSDGVLATPYEVVQRIGDRAQEHRKIAALAAEAEAESQSALARAMKAEAESVAAERDAAQAKVLALELELERRSLGRDLSRSDRRRPHSRGRGGRARQA